LFQWRERSDGLHDRRRPEVRLVNRAVIGTAQGQSVKRRQPADGEAQGSMMIVDEHRVGVWRFGTDGGWPLVWHHGGLICGLDAKVIDMAARQCGADIISLDRPGIGRSDHWSMTSIAHWPHTVEQVANHLHLVS
jgi:pimeloyl-ACP methyl ester carboxylesterase